MESRLQPREPGDEEDETRTSSPRLQPSDLSLFLLIVSPTGAVACSSGDDRKAS